VDERYRERVRENGARMKEKSILGYFNIFGYWDDVSRADVQWHVANGGLGTFFPKRGPAQKRLAAILPQQSRNSNPPFELPGAFPGPRVLFTQPRVAAHLVGLGDIGIYQQ
jgi:hypothetical protein